MTAQDMTDTPDLALQQSGLALSDIKHRPRLLSGNRPCYVASDLANYLQDQKMTHTRGRPYHPMTQGKIERRHRSLKSCIKLEHYYLPGDLKAAIGRFVHYYNTRGCHESLNNLPHKTSTWGPAKPSSKGVSGSNARPYSSDAPCTKTRRPRNIVINRSQSLS
jgi:putative transposase